MKKYFSVLRISILHELEHRTNNLLWFFVGLIPALVSYACWMAIYGERESINGLLKEDLLSYFLLIIFFWYLIGGTTSIFLAEHIRKGEISHLIIKPIHPIIFYAFRQQGWKLTSILIITPITICFWIIFNLKFPIVSFFHLFQIVLVAIFAGIIFSIWDMIIGMSAFFVHNIIPINRFNRIVYYLISGTSIPLVFFPTWSLKIINFLFYRYTFGYANEIVFQN